MCQSMSNELRCLKSIPITETSCQCVESSVELTLVSNFVLSVNALKFFCELFLEFGPVSRLEFGLSTSSCIPGFI